MTKQAGYKQFCPVAMAAEILCNRWTVLVIRELLAGSTRFNELRKGLPRMSPALLSKRLKELEEAGIAKRSAEGHAGGARYRLTEAGRDLEPLVMSMGIWGQRWLESRLTLRNLDPALLMWDMQRNLRPARMGKQPAVVQFVYRDLAGGKRCWWLVVENALVDLCYLDPGREVDLLVATELAAMTQVWMGLLSVNEAVRAGRMKLEGDDRLKQTMPDWLGLSPFAKESKRVA